MGGRLDSDGKYPVWRIDHPDLRARAYVSADGTRLNFVRACWPDNAQKWRMLECSAVHDTKADISQIGGPGLPPDADVIATRLDPQGRMCAKMVQVKGDLANTYAQWKNMGWRVSVMPPRLSPSVPFSGDMCALVEKDGRAYLVQQLKREKETAMVFISKVPD
jgi:hypothetical protein